MFLEQFGLGLGSTTKHLQRNDYDIATILVEGPESDFLLSR